MITRFVGTKISFQKNLKFSKISSSNFIRSDHSFSTTNSPHINKVVELTEAKNSGLTPIPTTEKDWEKWGLELYLDFISEKEEEILANEAMEAVKRLKYEKSHWDKVIMGYRETEKGNWNAQNVQVILKMKSMFSPQTKWLYGAHILDLEAEGYIAPHIDSVKFSGGIVAGLSLLSDSLMRLEHDTDPTREIFIHLPRRSFYIMRNDLRYHWKHEILSNSRDPTFKGKKIIKSRRISIILRDILMNSNSIK